MLSAYCRITQAGAVNTSMTGQVRILHASLSVGVRLNLRCGALTTLGETAMAAKKAAKKPAKKAAKKAAKKPAAKKAAKKPAKKAAKKPAKKAAKKAAKK